jgi:uncharacterized protein (DUF1501 family)
MNRTRITAFVLTLLAASTLGAQTPPQPDLRTLVVVNLAGGSDGLNTVIPYADPAYLAVRSSEFVDPKAAVPLTDTLGLHPALAPLVEPWKAGDLAIVLGVGYPNPNRSHFRSIAIWETASDAQTVATTGWLARLVRALPPDKTRFADSVIIGEGTSGPLGGPWMHNLTLSSLDGFLRDANDLGLLDAPAPTQAEVDGTVCVTTGPQYEVASVGGDISRWAKALQALKAKLPDFGTLFPKTAFGRQAELAAQLLAAGVDVPVIKLTLRGYDTHVDEAKAQAALHKDFAETMVAFRKALVQARRWQTTVVMTYSEFGRRVEGNGSGGTDHGTAAPLFVMGGTVKGGQFVGTQPSLADLTSGDLKFSVDFHEVYDTLVKKFWGLIDATVSTDISGGKAGDLPLFKN